MKKKRFVGFGEIMVRLTPEGYLRFSQADRFLVNYTGAEANMAVALAHMGLSADIVTKLPDNEIAQCALKKMKMYGVNTDRVQLGGDRIGVYYLEKGASQRPSKVIYDRKYSSLSMAGTDEFDWDTILEGADWFHFTGITAALSDNCATMCRDACLAAKRLGVKVSCDLNYRQNLWTPKQAQAVMKPLMKYVDVLIANEEDSDKMLGISPADTDVHSGKLSLEGYQDLARTLCQTFGFTLVANTLRESISASVNHWSALLYDGEKHYFSKKYTIHLVDRVGGGDSFASGLIYALLTEMSLQDSLEFAVAASCLKQTIEQDFNLSTVDEVKTLMAGDGSGRVVR